MGNGSGKMGAFLTEMIELSANLLDKPALSKDVPAELHHPLHPLNNPLPQLFTF
jgi:hypothetical protein